MITQFRRYTNSWIARGFFIIMAVSFVGWGISGDLFRLMGPPRWVAKVGGQTIEIPAFQAEYQRALAQRTRDLPSGQEATPALRRQVGQQTLERMIAQAALGQELKDLRVVTPDEAVVATAQSMPAFQGSDGKFSKAVFENVLRNNGFTEPRFLEQLRGDIAQRQVLSTLGGSVAAPDAEVKPLYETQFEKRAADMALFPFSAAPEPAAPDEAELQRWYDNHPDSYSTPEYRRIKAIELSPQSLSSEITVTDEELHSAYEEHKAEYVTPEKRSAEVISAPDEAKARTLADKWRGGTDWAAMQAAAQAEGASAIAQDDATPVQFPDPDLAKAVFSTPADAVSEPVKGQLGWFVVKVTKITGGTTTTFEQVKDKLRQQVLASKAADLMYDRANKLDQLLGNGTGLDNLPDNLGVVGVTGTLDSKGDTQAGAPAPIPGPAELKSAIMAAAFQARQGDPPQLTEVQTPVHRRVGILCAGGREHYPARQKTVRCGEEPGDGRLEGGPAATVPGSGGDGDDACGSGRKIVLRCRDGGRGNAKSQPAGDAQSAQRGHRADPAERYVRSEKGRGDDGRNARRLRRRTTGGDRETGCRSRQGWLRPGARGDHQVDEQRHGRGFRRCGAPTRQSADQSAGFR